MERIFTTIKIKNKVSNYFKFPDGLIDKKTREREIVVKRQIAHYLSKKLTKDSLATIGKIIGSVHHATVLHSCKVINNLIDTDKNYRAIIKDVELVLHNSRIYGTRKYKKIKALISVLKIAIFNCNDFEKCVLKINRIVYLEIKTQKIKLNRNV